MPDANLVKVAAEASRPFVSLDLNTVFNSLILIFVGAGVKRLTSIRDHLNRLNGSVVELKQWREDHIGAEQRIITSLERGEVECKASMRRELDMLWGRVGDRRTRNTVESD